VATLDSRKNPRPGESPFVKITAAEYSENFGVDMDTAYRQLREGADNLLKRLITFYVPAFNRKGKPIEDAISKMRWVGKVTYHQKEGWVELHFWHEVVPHLLGLKKQFTSYQLQQASALRSVYSWKLLELLMRFKDTGWAEYTIEDFCESMEATLGKYDAG
jgi:plasmid replication initiation protein